MNVSEGAVLEAIDSRKMELILLPTEKCNFRCTYCYEDFSIGRMSRDTVAAIKLLIARRVKKLSALSISWFGGEPLLARDVVLEVGKYAHDMCDESGVLFSGGLTTNGYYLEPDVLRGLSEIGHRSYQITLDGDEEFHDRTRILANGRGTFKKIWNNLLRIRDSDVASDVMLRIHVGGSNVASLESLIDKINDDFSNCGKFSVHFHRISDLGGPGGRAVVNMTMTDYNSIVDRLRQRLRLRATSEVSLVQEGYICYAAKPNSLLVRADGRIGKCTVALNDSRNDVGVLDSDGKITFNNRRLKLWFEGFREQKVEELSCPLAYLGREYDEKTIPVTLTSEDVEVRL